MVGQEKILLNWKYFGSAKKEWLVENTSKFKKHENLCSKHELLEIMRLTTTVSLDDSRIITQRSNKSDINGCASADTASNKLSDTRASFSPHSWTLYVQHGLKIADTHAVESSQLLYNAKKRKGYQC